MKNQTQTSSNKQMNLNISGTIFDVTDIVKQYPGSKIDNICSGIQKMPIVNKHPFVERDLEAFEKMV